ncbi:DNA polymerase III subunit chi [Sulfitobacter albidus]|uniref:DNA polymerase III subunit chi n=1 Tax=Sulfitobacter albidus TaxID=2829501 RepID=A0A975JFZ2_9RHOB|nr:DNA polymerase III subunit chi [Sulfitobacter albidus]QUJ77560.1 DNA polymerase III subunit chi [Sulfitobacter albidus]
MANAMFYHLTQRPLDATLRMLLEKSLAADWRVAVRGTDEAGLRALDQALWLGAEDSFLPHGLAGGAHDAAQPILLGTGDVSANAPQCLMAVHSADVSVAEAQGLERVCILFDDDDVPKAHARTHWKTLTDAGIKAQYWSDQSGRWEMLREA